ncbi:MAG: hypothetical protein R3B47_02680 [Bacteroidia bacterium]
MTVSADQIAEYAGNPAELVARARKGLNISEQGLQRRESTFVALTQL